MPTYDIFGLRDTTAAARRQENMDNPPGFLDALPAALRINNSMVSAFHGPSIGHQDIDLTYRASDDPMNEGYLQHDSIWETVNPEHARLVRERIDIEQENRRILAESNGWTNFGVNAIAIASDPLVLMTMALPGAAAIRSGHMLRAAATEGALAGTGEVIAETALHASQETRELSESGINVLASTILGSALGGGLAALYKGVENSAYKAAKDELADILRDSEGQSGGAAERQGTMYYQARSTEEADIALETEIARREREGLPPLTETQKKEAHAILQEQVRGPRGLMKIMSWMSPINTLFSPSRAARHLGRHIAETPLAFQGTEASPVAIESLVKNHMGRKQETDRLASEVYKAAKHPMKQSEFMQAAGKAMRMTDPTGDEAIDKVVDMYRKRVYEPLTKEALDIGLFDTVQKDFKDAFAAYTEARLPGMTRTQFLDDVAEKYDSGQRFDETQFPEKSPQRKAVAKVNAYIDKRVEDGLRPRALRLIGAQEYLNRVYDRARVIENNVEFKGILRRHFTRMFEADIANIEARIEQGPARYMKDQKLRGELELARTDLREIENEVAALRQEKRRLLKEEKATDPKLNAKIGREEAKLGRARKTLDDLQKRSEKVDAAALERFNRLRTDTLNEAIAKLEDVDGVVDEIYNKIAGSPYGKLPPGTTAKGDPLHDRMLNIQDQEIEYFLENDLQTAADHYVREMAPSIEFHKRFDGRDMGEVMQEVEKDWDYVIAQAPQNKRRKLTVKKARDRSDLTAVWERVLMQRGYVQDPTSTLVRGFQAMRAVTMMSKLGRMTVSAISDLARPLMVHGQKDAAVMAGKLISDSGLRQMSIKKLREAGIVTELAANTRMLQLTELMGVSSFMRPWEKYLHNSTQTFAKLTGMVHMNEATKHWVGTTYADQLVKAVRKEDWDNRVLRDYGIGPNEGRVIKQQIEQYGEKVDVVDLPNTSIWSDRQSADIVEAAIRKAIDESIITPGAFDRPKWMDSEAGKWVGQFRSFMFASNTRSVMAGLSGHNAAFYLGMAEMTFLGVTAFAIKGILAGRGEEVEKTLTGGDNWRLANEAIAQSGLGVMPEAWSLMAKMLTPDKAAARYAVRNNIGAIAGPNFGMSWAALELVQSIFRQVTGMESMTEQDAKKVIRMIPYNNLWYLQALYSRIPGMEWSQ